MISTVPNPLKELFLLLLYSKTVILKKEKSVFYLTKKTKLQISLEKFVLLEWYDNTI